ncbi:dipeptide/oligopeptide/nickel ABC transporter ATP-binding protein [Mangrovactinospora gilvigrisea]|uniref:Dipeptide/oligopeptide/nickel ABC transporter ATP-binding protein n=1 Tax=Mangrovactinospora gilvigrisea TaxID=1428644 RepID=A0A1J7BJ55_9ACTN|nr:ABC transporter ATP-binding protein [Mangrovactinospora gilvigrisea]OIV38670.1 dipeptide/oligopeptide/nickel ABC transporter ATP-binding protein [Mangrovactinospora gilvigrisea]
MSLSPELSLRKDDPEPFLQVTDLAVDFATADGSVRAVDGLNFTLERGRTLGLVGESGSGKSVTSLAVMGLLRPDSTTAGNARTSGEIRLNGEELLSAPARRIRELRGRTMSMIFQDPLSALHPYYSVGAQIAEAYRVHHKGSRKAAKERAAELLGRVGIPRPRERADDFPHQFSGGMRQRVMIAMALVNDPELLIADEPTTALDVTVQAQILELIADVQQEFGSAAILITHDLGVVAGTVDDVVIMYAGRTMETAPVDRLFAAPQHPYTWGLLGSTPRLDGDRRKRLAPIPGSPPNLLEPAAGCPFAPRCVFTDRVEGDACATDRPAALPACHLAPDDRDALRPSSRKAAS